ncbi:MAG: membrane protein insertase YidC [Phycisphaerae bacterium]|nr:membrane protein insertase YidC [Phycisphaerae bacterium]
MNIKKIPIQLAVILFALCGIAMGEVNAVPQTSSIRQDVDISATNGPEETFTLGSPLPAESNNPYKLELVLTTKGAAVTSASLRDYDDRNCENPQPLKLLSATHNTTTLANVRLLLPGIGKAFPLNRLNWQSAGVNKNPDGSETITFYANILKDNNGLIKPTKTYTLQPENYLLDCVVGVENLSGNEVKTSFDMLGPVGIVSEDDRRDARTIVAGFMNSQGAVETAKINIKKILKDFGGQAMLFHENAEFKFIWAAISDKYFVSIIRPVPTDENNTYCDWLAEKYGVSFDPDAMIKDDENIGIRFRTQTASIAPKQQISYKFQVYIGPKDRDLFNGVPLYHSLGFIKTIDFQACCGDIFSSLSFAILAAMNWLYGYIPNYGVVIIIFVFVVRVLLHPITKKSQVSMMKMSKLAPMAEEIKKRYGDNKAEMQKQLGKLYKEQGMAPMLGCMPMMLQMPIWIALYSAIYAGIEFRGAAFLPFWITDLSSPDALFALPAAVEHIPFVGSFIGTSFNLLPIFLGIAMFAQQKLMPSSAPSSNPQAAQQQKMMLWMMPVMMLMFLYRAPSGLNLYIMASTTAGVVEQYIIKKHIKEREALEEAGLVPTTSKLGGKLKKKKPKPPIRFS